MESVPRLKEDLINNCDGEIFNDMCFFSCTGSFIHTNKKNVCTLTNNTKAEAKCPENYELIDNICYENCDKNHNVLSFNNKKCIPNNIESANPEYFAKYRRTIRPFYECQDGLYLLGNLCFKECPSNFLADDQNLIKRCMPLEQVFRRKIEEDPLECKNNQDKIEGKCYDKCPEKKEIYSLDNKKCIDKDFVTYYNRKIEEPNKSAIYKIDQNGNKNEVKNCNRYKELVKNKIYFDNGKECENIFDPNDKLEYIFDIENKCNENFELINGLCYEICPPLDNNNTFKVDDNDKSKCIAKLITNRSSSNIGCSNGETVYNNGQLQCFEFCNNDKVFDKNSVFCNTEIPQIENYRENKTLLKSCKENQELINNFCYDSCPNGYEIDTNDNTKCTKILPKIEQQEEEQPEVKEPEVKKLEVEEVLIPEKKEEILSTNENIKLENVEEDIKIKENKVESEQEIKQEIKEEEQKINKLIYIIGGVFISLIIIGLIIYFYKK